MSEQSSGDVGREVALLLLGVDVLLVTLDLRLLAGVEVAQLAEVSLPLVLLDVAGTRRLSSVKEKLVIE